MQLDRYGAQLSSSPPPVRGSEAGEQPDPGHCVRSRPSRAYGSAVPRRGRRRVPGAAALRTPPWKLVLSEVDDEGGWTSSWPPRRNVPGVVGARWPRVSHHGWLPRGPVGDRDGERVSSSTTATPRRFMRPQSADRPLLVEWIAFEARRSAKKAPLARPPRSTGWSGKEALWLWDDRAEVAHRVRRNPERYRIGPVYTPPGDRRWATHRPFGRGQPGQLYNGRRFCSSTPTSRIRRQTRSARRLPPVTDAMRIDFVP
jgi:hypothetical protein